MLKWKKPPVKAPRPTDNDSWECLLRTKAQLGKKVAELEEQLANVKRERDYATEHLVILAKTFKLDGMTWSYVVSEVCSRFERLKNQLASHPENSALDHLVTELQSKLNTAEARLKQLEWRPVSMKPTKEDADAWGRIPVTRLGEVLYQYINNWDQLPSNVTHWRPFAPPTPSDTDRVEFEKWALQGQCCEFDLIWDEVRETYTSPESQIAWNAWKAARTKEVKL